MRLVLRLSMDFTDLTILGPVDRIAGARGKLSETEKACSKIAIP